MPMPEILRQLMFLAAAYDQRQTRACERSMSVLLAEIAERGHAPLTDEQIEEIIQHY